MLLTPALYLAIALTVLQAFDGWTTYQGLKHPSIYETNPRVQWLMDKIGKYWGLFAAKAFATACVWIVALVPIDEDYRLIALAILAAYYANVVMNNWDNLQEAKEGEQ